jgi:micrococcal nuclease
MINNNAFDFYSYKAIVVSVYDGDSVTMDIDLGLGVWKKGQKIRLLGIDAPEMRLEEREAGLISKARVVDLVLNKEVVVQTKKTGKYGRWLGTIWFLDGENGWRNLNNLLVSEGLAEVYMK